MNGVPTGNTPPSVQVVKGSTGTALLELHGAWTIDHWSTVQDLRATLEDGSSRIPAVEMISGAGIELLDTAGAMVLLALAEKRQARLDQFSPPYQRLLQFVAERSAPGDDKPVKTAERGVFFYVGRSVVDFWQASTGLLGFFGRASLELADVVRRPGRFRMREFFVQLETVCIDAVGIVALVSVLIGTVVAYLFASQMQRYGAALFVVDTIGIAMCRELSPLIAAVIMAGRSGSAFTAQIGTMKMNEEIDALQVMGLSPVQVLVLPRVLALMIALPLLVFVGDLIGILGGFFVAQSYLDITSATFFQRLREVLTMNSFAVGFIKAPVFALVIGLIGCRMGFISEPNARSVGLSTTSTVVQSIVAVIILDALFAVWFVELGI